MTKDLRNHTNNMEKLSEQILALLLLKSGPTVVNLNQEVDIKELSVYIDNHGYGRYEVQVMGSKEALQKAKEKFEQLEQGNVDLYSYLRPEVQAFAIIMESVLRKNDYKGGWEDLNSWQMLGRMEEERVELSREMPVHGKVVNAVKLVTEAADVSNFSMMIADNNGGLDLEVVRHIVKQYKDCGGEK